MAYEYNESGIESSYDIHDWSNNVIISDTRMDNIDKGIVNLYNAIFGNEAENINGIIHHFESKNNTVNNIIGTRPNDNNDTIFDNIKKLWHNITEEENTDETRTPYGKIVDLQNGLGTLNIDSSTTAFGHIKTLETNLGNRNNNDPAFNEIETAKSRLTTLETKLGPAPQDEEDKNTAFDRVATLETNLETLTTNIQPDLKIIENSNIISIDDAAPLVAEELMVDIEPVQDLHGYDHPWPAGGGKNMLPDITGARTTNSIFIGQADGTAYPIYLEANTTYSVSVIANSGAIGVQVYIKENGGSNIVFANGASGTYTPTQNMNVQMWVYAEGLTSVSQFQLEKGSTPTAWTPYSNICPITGWTGANVWDDPAYGGTIEFNQHSTTTRSEATWFTTTHGDVQNGVAHIWGEWGGTNGAQFRLTLSNNSVPNGHIILVDTGRNDGLLSCRLQGSTTGSALNHTIITANTDNYVFDIVIGLYKNLGEALDFTFIPQIFDLTQMFGTGNEPTTYEAFRKLFPKDYYAYNEGEETCVSAVNGDNYNKYPITFPSEAGTVYGGTLNVTNGVLTVDRAMVTLTEDVGYSITTNDANRNRIAWGGYDSVGKQNGTFVSDTLATAPNGTGGVSTGDWQVFGSTVASRCWITVPKTIASVNDFKAYVQQHPIQICYELATPITYQLTPPAITLLRGNNNIWADCGNITMKYWQDKVLYENFYTKTQTNNLLLPLNEITTLDNRMVALEETLEDTVREETDKALLKTTFKLTLPYLTASILTKEKEYKIRLLDINYPIGSIYMTLNNADPKNILGGKWIPISQGRVLLGAGNNISDGTTTKSFTVGSTGGEYNHKLIIDEMPAHNHNVYYSNTKGTETGSVLTRATKTKRKTASDVVINKGGNTGHNNIQPYLVCNIWQRVIEDIHDVMRTMDSGTYKYLFKVDNEVPLVIDDHTTIIMVIDQIDTEKNYVYFRQKYTEGMEPCSNSEINDKLTSFQNSIPSDVKLALVGNPTLPEATTFDGVEVWATSNQEDTEVQRYLLPRICLKTIDMSISSNIVDAEDSGHSF